MRKRQSISSLSTGNKELGMNAKVKKVHTTIEEARESLWECSFARVDFSIVKELKDALEFDNCKYRFSIPTTPMVVDVEALG
jgi:hypothetical protein